MLFHTYQVCPQGTFWDPCSPIYGIVKTLITRADSQSIVESHLLSPGCKGITLMWDLTQHNTLEENIVVVQGRRQGGGVRGGSIEPPF